MLKKVLTGTSSEVFTKAEAPNRPPILCPGCPHRSVFSVLNKLKIHAAGDIGCYTLGAVAPLNVIDTTICMGSSISVLHGIEKAHGKEYIKNWVATIGDSTFLHTGVNSLINMVYNKAHGTVMILDNRTTGMTGHQEHAATGKTLKGEDTYAIDLAELCRAIGVKRVIEVDAFDTAELERVIRESVDELTVIIAKAPCALLKGQSFPDKCVALSDKCKKCGLCLKIGCPALTKTAEGYIKIDETMCNGCGLCMSYCKFGAIEKVKR
jgi:indolepyruvate ferredoxin oxidoreductase alpha subunit